MMAQFLAMSARGAEGGGGMGLMKSKESKDLNDRFQSRLGLDANKSLVAQIRPIRVN